MKEREKEREREKEKERERERKRKREKIRYLVCKVKKFETLIEFRLDKMKKKKVVGRDEVRFFFSLLKERRKLGLAAGRWNVDQVVLCIWVFPCYLDEGKF